MDSIVCFSCGAQSDPDLSACIRCGRQFTQVCPRCGAVALLPKADRCSECDLARNEFFEECQRAAAHSEAAKFLAQRRKVTQSVVVLLFGVGSFAFGLWFHFNDNFGYRNVALVVAGIYILAWVVIVWFDRDLLLTKITTSHSSVNQ